MMIRSALFFLLALAGPHDSGHGWVPVGIPLQAPDTVHFSPDTAQPTFAVREPVLTVEPGTVLVSNTNWGGYSKWPERPGLQPRDG
jgi:hypothetical protein